MTYTDILDKFGHIIDDYFKYIIPQNESHYLLVDDFLFENFLDKMQSLYKVPPQQVYHAYRNLKCSFQHNPYIALAIAAYQVMVYYLLDTNTSSDAYNDKLFSSIAYKGFTCQEYWYQDTAPCAPSEGCALQEKLWALVKKEFHIVNIPANARFGDRNRYVQYPKSQNLLGSSMRMFRIQFADKFIRLGLEPNQAITYDAFSDLVFSQNQYTHPNEMIRRMIFSFYCMWDGRSYQEIFERKHSLSREQKEKQAKDEFIVQLQPELRIYINRERIDLNAQQINDKYLYRFDSNYHLTQKGYIFIKDDDYNDWMPYNRKIDADEEVLLITKQADFPNYVMDFVSSGEVEIIPAGQYKILLLDLRKRESFSKFKIELESVKFFL